MPYVSLALFFLLSGWFWTSPLFLAGQATMSEFFTVQPLLLAIFIPAFTMRLFAEEYKSGTLESLATLPLSDTDIVLGKWGGAMAVWCALMAMSLCYGVLLIFLGPPDVGQMLAGYAGLFLLGAFYASLGLLASSLTRSQVVAFLVGFLFCFVFFIIGKAAQYIPGVTGRLMDFLSVDAHMDAFMKGVVDTRDIVYFLTGTLMALAGTLASFNSRRWR